MTRAWLILADILVTLLLFLSLILFYLSPPQKTDTLPGMEENATFRLPAMDYNATITLEDLIRMGEEAKRERVLREEYMREEFVIENKYLSRTLEEGLTEVSGKVGDPVFIRIFKEESLLEVWMRTGTEYRHLKDYAICAYSGALGPKLKEGDRQAPEGFYKVKKYQLNPNSKFHLSFNLGYPNAFVCQELKCGRFRLLFLPLPVQQRCALLFDAQQQLFGQGILHDAVHRRSLDMSILWLFGSGGHFLYAECVYSPEHCLLCL